MFVRGGEPALTIVYLGALLLLAGMKTDPCLPDSSFKHDARSMEPDRLTRLNPLAASDVDSGATSRSSGFEAHCSQE